MNRLAALAAVLLIFGPQVETHLGSAYRKLDISSRGELPSVLEGG